MIEQTLKGKIQELHRMIPNSGLRCFTAGGFWCRCRCPCRGDCYRRYIPYDNEGAWVSWVVGGQRRTRGVESKEARKHGDLVVPGGERGISMGGFTDPACLG